MTNKLLTTMSLIGLTTFGAFAQQQLEHPKKMYLNDDKIYVQETMPIYIFMGTTPEKKDAVLMKSETEKEHSNPMHLDGHGIHYIKHHDHEKEVEVKFEIYADAITPSTKHSFGSVKTKTKDGKVYGGATDITLTAKDQMAGVAGIYYSVNGAPYQKYTTGISCKEENKTYDIKYYSVDNVGNIEKVNSVSYVVDTKAPVTTHKIHGDQHNNNIISKRSRFSLIVEESGVGNSVTYFSIDGSKEVKYDQGIYPAYLPEGEHTLTYYSVDKVGNKETTKSFKFFIDKTAPTVVKEIIGDKFVSGGKEYQSGRSKIKLTSMDNKAGVKKIYYSINGADYKEYTEPFYAPKIKGVITIVAYATDNVNNEGKDLHNKKLVYTAYMDLSGPSLKHKFYGNVFTYKGITYINQNTKVKLIGIDGETGLKEITYKVNGATTQTYSEPLTFDKEAAYVVEYTGYDNVQNTSEAKVEFTVDMHGPTIEKSFSLPPNAGKYPRHVQLYLSATDIQVGTEIIYYSINGGPEKRYTAPIKGLQPDKEYKIKVRALDHLNNESTEEIIFTTEDH